MARGKTAAVRRGEARLYLGKADQFLEQARVALDARRYDAALLNAVHAAISGTDAVTVALAGRRSTDPDHQRSVDLLEESATSAPRSGSGRVRSEPCWRKRTPWSTSRGRPALGMPVAGSNEPVGSSSGLARCWPRRGSEALFKDSGRR